MLTLIPAEQRRTLPELVDRLDLRSGEQASKTSAFWIMLTLSGVIAVSGIAPLSTPILGIGLGIVTGRGRLILSSLGYVAAGLVLVTLLGIVVSQLLPNPTNVLANSQVLGRTSPTLIDLLAAIATGLAGAVAITRRDVGDVLPGVAIPMVLNSLSSLWSRQVATATDSWLADGGARSAEVTGVSWSGSTVTVNVLAPQDLPDVAELQRTVDDLVPWDPQVVVMHTVGARESAG